MTRGPLLNRETVQRRLLAIRERVAELSQLGEVTGARLRSEWMTRAAIERVLTQLVELAAQVNTHIATANGRVPPAGYRQSFAAAADIGALPPALATRLSPSAGLRNILVHDYLDADLDIVARSAHQAAIDYSDYVREIAEWLASQRT